MILSVFICLYTAPGVVVHTTSFASNTTVNVMWNPPVTPNGVITSYVVMYTVYERNDFTSSDMLGGSVTTYLVDGLSKYSVCQCVSLTAFIHYSTWYTLSSKSNGIYQCW